MAKEVAKVSGGKNAAVKKIASTRASAPVVNYQTEVHSGSVPTIIKGDVVYVKEAKGYRIRCKRPRSPKIDTFLVPETELMMAREGEGGSGYILTNSPQFNTAPIFTTLDNAEVTADSITGTDDTGAQMFINRRLIDVTVRNVSYAD